jgi:hypothetical protein
MAPSRQLAIQRGTLDIKVVVGQQGAVEALQTAVSQRISPAAGVAPPVPPPPVPVMPPEPGPPPLPVTPPVPIAPPAPPVPIAPPVPKTKVQCPESHAARALGQLFVVQMGPKSMSSSTWVLMATQLQLV